jgi:hypothetical protein
MFLKLWVEEMEALIPDGDQATLNSLTKPAEHQTGQKRALGWRKTYFRASGSSFDDQQIVFGYSDGGLLDGRMEDG